MGEPGVVQKFCARFGEESRCIADPGKHSYKAMGLEKYNLLRLFTDRELLTRRNENRAAGFRQNWRATRMEDASQLPGAAFFDKDGVMRWLYRGKHPGDLPTMSAMLATVIRSTTEVANGKTGK